jgi:DNA-binding XRE family transcriptional regulator
VKPDTYCTVHKLWYARACPTCDAEAYAECEQVLIEGRPCEPRDALRRARRVAGLSQKSLVRTAGLGYGTVWRWESGAAYPRIDLWLRALNACGYRVRVEKIE